MFRGADDGFVTHRSWLLGPDVITTKLSVIVEIGRKHQTGVCLVRPPTRPLFEQAGAPSGLLVNVLFRGADDGFVTHMSWLLAPEVIMTKLSGIVEIGWKH